MTDHAEYFDQESLRVMWQNVNRSPTKHFVWCAGLEYRCERNMHILAYCATKLTHSVDPEEVIRHIGSQGAVAVIAHSKDDLLVARLRGLYGGKDIGS